MTDRDLIAREVAEKLSLRLVQETSTLYLFSAQQAANHTVTLWNALLDSEEKCRALEEKAETYRLSCELWKVKCQALLEGGRKPSGDGADEEMSNSDSPVRVRVPAPNPLEEKCRKLQEFLYECIVELSYVQSAEDISQCASAKGEHLFNEGMKLLGVKDLSAEKFSDALSGKG